MATTKKTDKELAQYYAQQALSGKSGIYIPASQTENALLNAGQSLDTATSDTKSATATSKKQSQAYNAYAAALAQQEAAYRRQQELAAKQRADEKAALDAQNSLLKQNLRTQLENTLEENNRQAEKSLREAYTAYMLSARNLAQQLKALGISGGGSETVLADLANKYTTGRLGIEESRNTANSTARQKYDADLNEYQIDYLAALAKIDSAYSKNLASLAASNQSALATLAKSAVNK